MEELTAKIAKQSKVVLILAQVARIILYVMAGIAVAALIGSFLEIGEPAFVLFGKPIYWMGDIAEGMTPEAFRVSLVETLIQIGLALALLFQVSGLFKRIEQAETPFTQEAIKKMKSLAIMLGVIIGLDNGYLGVVMGFVVYAFAMMFEYSAELQKQVDETL